MAVTNRERVGKALDLLKAGLGPFADREVKNAIKAKRLDEYGFHQFHDDPKLKGKSVTEWDAAALLKLMWDTWNDVFRYTLGHTDRSLVSELREWRNKWAHQEHFSSEDTDRTLDSAERLLTAVSASQAGEVNRMKMELRRLVMDEQARGEKRKAAGTLIESAGTGALKPWREVAMPHNDVATGGYQQAEFAADLWQVHLGEGSDEYRDPQEFFRRTYLTESLRRLLEGAARTVGWQGRRPRGAVADQLRRGQDAFHVGALPPVFRYDAWKARGNGRGAGGRGRRETPVGTARCAGWKPDIAWESG